MASDIVFPNGNEEEFIRIAEWLGYSGLRFVYEISQQEKTKSKINALQATTKIKLEMVAISDFSGISKAKKFSEIVLVESSENNRQLLEKSSKVVLFGLEKEHGKDYIHHRASGLNHILCALAKKNKIEIGFSLSSILNSNNTPKTLGRIAQNLRLCRKYKVETIFASFAKKPFEMRAEKDIKGMFDVLGNR